VAVLLLPQAPDELTMPQTNKANTRTAIIKTTQTGVEPGGAVWAKWKVVKAKVIRFSP
jgi:hypothetical protein